MIGILTEKPSQARNFAKALGGMSGVYQGEEYVIVPARGHLYEFAEPEQQVPSALSETYKSWKLEHLPWDETQLAWKYKKGKDVTSALQAIKKTLTGCDEVVIGTDDDPTGEGELIAWQVFSELGLRANKYTRMFFADESEKEIQKAFVNRKLLGNSLSCMYQDPDYRQAIFRSKWDYLSIQWTRVATAFAPYPQMPRQGRLKSAMVKIVGDQLEAIKNYVKKPFYEARFKDENGNVFTNPEVEKFDQKGQVPIGRYQTSPVICDKKTMKSTAPSKFLDLATLGGMLAPQGVPAKTVLSTYQKMYEAKVVSYPRTEDKCITIEQFNELLPLVDKIASVVGVDTSLLTHRTPRKTHVKTGMAHGANRPGPNVPTSLDTLDAQYGPGAKKIYQILARNYLATLAEDYEYELQQGHLQMYPDFKGSAKVPKSLGWKQVVGGMTGDKEDDVSLSGLGRMADPFVYEGCNPKPQAPTMQWLMKQLEKHDVGTGATRTSTYADVTNQKTKHPLLIEKKGKITMAPVGETSYLLLPGTHIGSLDMTERVSKEMKAIYEGTSDGEAFLHDVQRMVKEDMEIMRANSKNIKGGTMKQEKEKYEGTWKGKAVKFVREFSGHRFTDAECEALCRGEEISFKATSKAGKEYTCHGSLADKEFNGHAYVGFDPDFNTARVPDTFCKHDFSDAEKADLEAGKEIYVKGMVSKKGSVFDAYVSFGKKEDGSTGLILNFNKK